MPATVPAPGSRPANPRTVACVGPTLQPEPAGWPS
jgi:hypothetical protein